MIRKVLLAVALLCFAAFVFAAEVSFLADGTKTRLAFAFILALLPIAGGFALRQPLLFPFALYALLIPFDNLLSIGKLLTLTKIVAAASSAALVFFMIRTKEVVRPHPALFVWAALIVWMAMTVTWALQPDVALTKLFTYLQLFAVYAALSLYPVKKHELNVVVLALLAGSLVAAAYGIKLFHSQSAIQALELQRNLGRVVLSTQDAEIDPNHFAATLILPVAIVMMSALRTRLSLAKLGYLAAFVVLLGGVYVSASRGALVAVIAVFLYLLWKSRYRAQLIAVAMLGFVGGIGISNRIIERFAQASATGGSGRLSVWSVGFEALKHHWLIGAGTGNYPAAYDNAFIHAYQPYYQHWHRVAHNLILQTWVELGIIGLAMTLIAWYVQFNALRHIDKQHELYDFRLCLEAALLGLFVASFFLDLIWYKYAWMAFSLVMLVRSYSLQLGQVPAGITLKTPHVQQAFPTVPLPRHEPAARL
ncbi:MAG: O-antigen ligase family protein [Candidatus Eremiobacteraeota bacterium]|nr:O-antigen ligase family protein [Candidatus Eremiobacteraeota bacterium]